MFALIRRDAIQRLLDPEAPFELEGVQYPANWLTTVGETRRAALGILPVEADPAPEPFWFEVIGRDPPVLEGGKVRIGWAKRPKPLSDLKGACLTAVKTEARALLSETDWMVIRAAEPAGKPMPPAVAEWRGQVRAEAGRIESRILRAKDFDALRAAFGGLAWPPQPSA